MSLKNAASLARCANSGEAQKVDHIAGETPSTDSACRTRVRRPDLLDVFIERAEARAYLWRAGEYSLYEAINVLEADAERDHLVERIGPEAIQEIISGAFRDTVWP